MLNDTGIVALSQAVNNSTVVLYRYTRQSFVYGFSHLLKVYKWQAPNHLLSLRESSKEHFSLAAWQNKKAFRFLLQ